MSVIEEGEPERDRARRATETPEKTEARRASQREYDRNRRATLTPEQKEARCIKKRMQKVESSTSALTSACFFC